MESKIGSGVKCQRMASIIDRCPMSMPIHVQSLRWDYVLFSHTHSLQHCHWISLAFSIDTWGVLVEYTRVLCCRPIVCFILLYQLTKRWLCQWCDFPFSSSFTSRHHVTVSSAATAAAGPSAPIIRNIFVFCSYDVTYCLCSWKLSD